MKLLLGLLLSLSFVAAADEPLRSVQVDFPAFGCDTAPVSQIIPVPEAVRLKGYRASIAADNPAQVSYRIVDGDGNVLTADVVDVDGLVTDTLFYEGDFFVLAQGSTVLAEADCVDGDAEVFIRLIAFFSL